MVISTITPPCFPPPEGVRVISHHLPRRHPRRLDDNDELCCIMSQFHGVEDFLTTNLGFTIMLICVILILFVSF
jgi:hypothetical protein